MCTSTTDELPYTTKQPAAEVRIHHTSTAAAEASNTTMRLPARLCAEVDMHHTLTMRAERHHQAATADRRRQPHSARTAMPTTEHPSTIDLPAPADLAAAHRPPTD
jgi:hypothetical protein